MDDLILEKHINIILPARPKLAIADYIRDYRIKKSRNKPSYEVEVRKFLSNKWGAVMSFDIKYTEIVAYLKDPRKKESILFVTNGMIDRGYLPYQSFVLTVSDKIENVKNINNLLKI